MLNKKMEKDERTTFIENKSYKYGYNILSFGILIDILYRSIFIRFNQSSWDLFLLLGISGIAVTLYQYKQKIFTGNWKRSLLILIIFAAILSAAFTFIFKILS